MHHPAESFFLPIRVTPTPITTPGNFVSSSPPPQGDIAYVYANGVPTGPIQTGKKGVMSKSEMWLTLQSGNKNKRQK
jgi:hypothetical protein